MKYIYNTISFNVNHSHCDFDWCRITLSLWLF